jgi:hypothetical protein
VLRTKKPLGKKEPVMTIIRIGEDIGAALTLAAGDPDTLFAAH